MSLLSSSNDPLRMPFDVRSCASYYKRTVQEEAERRVPSLFSGKGRGPTKSKMCDGLLVNLVGNELTDDGKEEILSFISSINPEVYTKKKLFEIAGLYEMDVDELKRNLQYVKAGRLRLKVQRRLLHGWVSNAVRERLASTLQDEMTLEDQISLFLERCEDSRMTKNNIAYFGKKYGVSGIPKRATKRGQCSYIKTHLPEGVETRPPLLRARETPYLADEYLPTPFTGGEGGVQLQPRKVPGEPIKISGLLLMEPITIQAPPNLPLILNPHELRERTASLISIEEIPDGGDKEFEAKYGQPVPSYYSSSQTYHPLEKPGSIELIHEGKSQPFVHQGGIPFISRETLSPEMLQLQLEDNLKKEIAMLDKIEAEVNIPEEIKQRIEAAEKLRSENADFFNETKRQIEKNLFTDTPLSSNLFYQGSSVDEEGKARITGQVRNILESQANLSGSPRTVPFVRSTSGNIREQLLNEFPPGSFGEVRPVGRGRIQLPEGAWDTVTRVPGDSEIKSLAVDQGRVEGIAGNILKRQPRMGELIRGYAGEIPVSKRTSPGAVDELAKKRMLTTKELTHGLIRGYAEEIPSPRSVSAGRVEDIAKNIMEKQPRFSGLIREYATELPVGVSESRVEGIAENMMGERPPRITKLIREYAAPQVSISENEHRTLSPRMLWESCYEDLFDLVKRPPRVFSFGGRDYRIETVYLILQNITPEGKDSSINIELLGEDGDTEITIRDMAEGEGKIFTERGGHKYYLKEGLSGREIKVTEREINSELAKVCDQSSDEMVMVVVNLTFTPLLGEEVPFVNEVDYHLDFKGAHRYMKKFGDFGFVRESSDDPYVMSRLIVLKKGKPSSYPEMREDEEKNILLL